MCPSSQGTLEKILKEWDFNQTFSFNKTYKEAPNPSLRIANFGSIGLPVSERDAAGIKELVAGKGANDMAGGSLYVDGTSVSGDVLALYNVRLI